MPFVPADAIEQSSASSRRFVPVDQAVPTDPGGLAGLARQAVPTDAGAALSSGFQSGLAGLAHTGTAAVSTIEDEPRWTPRFDFGGPQDETLQQAASRLVGQWITQGASEETAFDLARQWLRRVYQERAGAAATGMPSDPTVADKVLAGAAAAPPMLAEAGAATAALGPAGLPALLALKASRDPTTGEFTGAGETAKGALEGAVMAAGLHWAAGAPTLIGRVARAGSVGGGLAAVHGGDASDIAAESIVMGGLGALARPRRSRFVPAERAAPAEPVRPEAPRPEPEPALPLPPKEAAPRPAPATPDPTTETPRVPVAPEPPPIEVAPPLRPDAIPEPPRAPTVPLPPAAEPAAPPPLAVAPEPAPITATTPTPRPAPKTGPDRHRFPVIEILKARGGVHPDSPLAGELRALGVTTKTHPGLYRRQSEALRSADNISLDEEVIFHGRGIATTDGYVPEAIVLRAIADEVAGRPYRTGDHYEREIADLDAAQQRAYEEGWVRDDWTPGRFERVPDEPAFSRRIREQRMAAAVDPGSQYVGFIEGSAAVPQATTKGATPLRRESILRDLATDLGLTVYQGRMGPRPRSVGGFFRHPIEELRIRSRGDLETTAHEAAHLIEKRFPEVTGAYRADPALNAELRSVSYDARKPEEGWAEFMRLWMTQPAQAERLTPRAVQYLDGLMRRQPELGEALTKARDGMTRWFAQDALTRAESKIGPAGGALTTPASWRDYLQQRLFDDLHGLKVAERTVRGVIPSAESSAYKTARLMRAKHDVAANTLKFGFPVRQPDGSVRYEGKGLNAILAPLARDGELEPFLRYMVGRRAAELRGRGKENLFTDQEIAAMLALEKPVFRRAADEYQEFNRGLVQFAVDSGVIAPSAAEAMSRYFYVPFFREGAQGGGRRGAVPGDVRAIHRLRGGTANLRDTLSNILENTDRLVDLAITNEARQQVAKLASEPGAGRFIVRIPTDSKRVSVLTEAAKRAFLEAKGLDPADRVARELIDAIWADIGPALEVWQHGIAPRGENLFAVLREGKPEYYEVGDPELLRALLAFNRPGTSSPLLAGFKNVAQYTITRDPRFMLRNIVRDQVSAGLMGRYGYRPVHDAARGIASRFREDSTYRDFVASGGGMGGLYSPEQVRSQLRAMARRGGLGGQRILDTPRNMKAAIDDASEAFELATRIGAFDRAVSQGVHPREAAYEAREISTDFAMRGDAAFLQFFLDTVPFLKAGLTGLHRAGRALTSDEHRGQVARRVGLLALVSAANAAHNYGNPLYDDQPDAVKHTYWHFLVPTKDAIVGRSQGLGRSDAELARVYREGTDQESREAFDELSRRYHHLMLPKNWEIGSIATVAELGMEGTLGKHPPEVAGQMAAALMRNFHLGIVPGALEPIAESVANRDFFTGSPIIPMSEAGKAPGFQYTPRTPLVLRDIGEATGLSPIEADHFLRSYFNAWATYGFMLADRLAYGDAVLDQPNPLLTSFVRADDTGSQPVRDLLDTYRELDRIHQTLLKLGKERDPERTAAFLSEHESDLRERARLKPAVEAAEDLYAFEKTVRGLRRLEDVQQVAEQWAKAQGDEAFVGNAKAQGYWSHAGALKAALVTQLRRARSRSAVRSRHSLTVDAMQDKNQKERAE